MAKNACKKHWPEYQKSAPAKSAAKTAGERRKAEIETLYTQGLLALVYKEVRKPVREDWETLAAEL